jgi:hypothetical protein
MVFHGIQWNSIEFYETEVDGIPWNLMEFGFDREYSNTV